MTAVSIVKGMKKMLKKFFKRFKQVDKIFLAGFTFLTLLSFALSGANSLWLASTLLGYSFIAWQVIRSE